MLLEIRSYRGIDRADIEFADGITLLAGKGHQGKTSIVESLVAITTSKPNLYGLTKAEAPEICHNSAKTGSITMKAASGTRQIDLPSFELRTITGHGLNCSPLALGQIHVAQQSENDRAKSLAHYLGATVDRKRLLQELTEVVADKSGQRPLSDEYKNQIADIVLGTDKLPPKGDDPWQSGKDWAEKTAAAKKALFKATTTFTWGSNQGLTFVPAGWEADMDAVDENLQPVVTAEMLASDLTAAQEHLEQQIRENAITEAEIDKLHQLVAMRAEQQAKLDEWRTRASEYEREIAGLDGREGIYYFNCKGCQSSYNVVIDEESRSVVITDRIPLPATAAKDLKTFRDGLANAETAIRLHQANLLSIQKAESRLAEIGDQAVGDSKKIDEARAAVRRAEARLKAWSAKQAGIALHWEIVGLLKAAELLGENGLRRRVLVSLLDGFNKELSQLCEVAKFKAVSIGTDLRVRYGGRPYALASKSERQGADYVLQLALARRENPSFVLFDDADRLDREDRNGFFGLLRAMKIRAVVAMMLVANRQSEFEVPDLAAAKCGTTYWVQEGKVTKYGVAQEAVPA